MRIRKFWEWTSLLLFIWHWISDFLPLGCCSHFSLTWDKWLFSHMLQVKQEIFCILPMICFCTSIPALFILLYSFLLFDLAQMWSLLLLLGHNNNSDNTIICRPSELRRSAECGRRRLLADCHCSWSSCGCLSLQTK